jgi:hypothetical protein
MIETQEPYEYILYIDEAGDDGLKRVKPLDKNGGSEWLCIGAVLTRVTFEASVVDWVKFIRSDIDARQGPVLHYRDLSPTKKKRACELLSERECLCFVVCSNKKNMRGHSNMRAAQRGGKQYFYNYCVRLLVERVTDLCFRDSQKKYGVPRSLRVVFSQRGGHSYGQTKAYWQILKNQSVGGTTFLDRRTSHPEVLKFGLVDYVPHVQNAGLQLADIVASSFYQAADALGPNWNPEPARLLRPRMAKERGVIADFGVVLQPTPPWKAELTEDQKLIFSEYGYSF